MNKKKIVIITGTGGALGTGHLQRMMNLSSYMNEKQDFETHFLIKSGDYPVPPEFSMMMISSLPESCDLIIRDMRNSTSQEMLSLTKTAPVLAVDDAGEGKSSSGNSINLLPLPSSLSAEIQADYSKFLYGYTFTSGIKELRGKNISERDIDITIYAGFSPPPSLLSQISKSIPENSRAVILSAGKPVVLTGDPLPDNISYSEILSRTKIVMTHFGLTMFEAHICGCLIAALNPTPYHGELTETVRKEMKIIHSAEYSTFDPVIMGDDLMLNFKKNNNPVTPPEEILNSINNGLENFTRYIYKILM